MTIQQLKQIQNNLSSAGFKDSAAIVSRFRSDPAALAAFLNNDFSPLGDTPQTVQNGKPADAPQAVQIGTASALYGPQTADDNKPSADNAQRSAMVQTSADDPQTIASTPQVIDTPPAPDLVQMAATAPQVLEDAPLTIAPQASADCPQVPQTMQPSPQAVPALRPVDDIVPAQTDLLQDTTDYTDLLPNGLYDDICEIITNFCQKKNIPDRFKIHPQQWQAACYDVGWMIKKRGLLNDNEKLRKYGGRYYNPYAVLALLHLYEYICSSFKQTAFSHNFPRFAGISDEYFKDYMRRGLSSTQVGLAQKAAEIQRASIVGAISGGGSATVGNIFLGKALAGLQETSTVVHVSAAPSVGMEELPKLGRLDG